MSSTTLELAGITVRAVSVAGMETCIEVPGWKLAFDIGRCPPSAVRAKRVLFTHAHVDHMGGIAHHVGLRALLGMSAPTYLVPGEKHAAVQTLLAAWREADGAELPCDVEPVRPGDVVPLSKNREVHVFRALHRVAAVGYALVGRRSRLAPAYRDRPGPELAAARARGETITEEVTRTEIAFCGDTTIDVVDHEPLVRTARVLVLECTFLDDRVSMDHVRRSGHVHLDQIAARADRFENEAILLTHFSARYDGDTILRLLDAKLPADLRARVTPLLPRPPWA